MKTFDVNIFVKAFREDAPDHRIVRTWLNELINRPEPFGVIELALSGFMPIVTLPKAFSPPDNVDDAIAFCENLRQRPNCVILHPGPRHWEIFSSLCSSVNAQGNLIPDTWYAAIAIEHECEFVTFDKHFSRFPDLKLSAPFRSAPSQPTTENS